MIVLIRGGGDLASGVALRLYRAGLRVVIAELASPLAVRRLVSFSEAVYSGETTVEGLTAKRVNDPADNLRVLQVLAKGQIPVLIDPEAQSATGMHPTVIVDARMTKQPPEPLRHAAQLYIGLGPGFLAPQNCHAVIETCRGHTLGRVIWQGAALADTGVPGPGVPRPAVPGPGVPGPAVLGGSACQDPAQSQRVLYAPAAGELETLAQIGDHLEAGQPVANVAGQVVAAPFKGVLRGLLPSGLPVTPGLKIGDMDPRDDPALCALVSDKALAVGGGVLEAILSRPNLRPLLWK